MNLLVNNLKLRKPDSQLIFAFGILVCILIAFCKEYIFPEKYFNDVSTIEQLVKYPYKDEGDMAYTNTANFFRLFYIDKELLAPILAISSYLIVIILVFKKYEVKLISFLKFLLIVAYSAMAMVYISTYSKDLVLFLLVIVPFVIFEKKNLLLWTLFVLFYAYFFRTYWVITILLFWTLKFFVVKKPKLLLVFIPFFYLLVSFVYNYIFGVSLSLIRYNANLDRDASLAQTAINTYISGTSFLLEAINFFLTFIFLIIPIPLLLLAKPFYIILSLLIVVFFYNFLRLYAQEYDNKKFANIFSFVIAFMLVQSLFEPDYGSFVRHLSPLYPIIFVCIAKNSGLFKIT